MMRQNAATTTTASTNKKKSTDKKKKKTQKKKTNQDSTIRSSSSSNDKNVAGTEEYGNDTNSDVLSSSKSDVFEDGVRSESKKRSKKSISGCSSILSHRCYYYNCFY